MECFLATWRPISCNGIFVEGDPIYLREEQTESDDRCVRVGETLIAKIRE